MSGFSRLQLAAALLEYDNDPDDPDAPHLNAKESAIFAHLRRAPRANLVRDTSDDDDDAPLRETSYRNTAFSRKSGSRSRSVDARKSMVPSVVDLGGDDEADDADQEILSSWGLDEFVEKKDRTSQFDPDGSRRSRTTSGQLLNPHGPPTPDAEQVNTSPIRRFPPKRPLSMGDMDRIAIGQSPERTAKSASANDYRKSMNAALDFAGPVAVAGDPHSSVAFPTTETPRPPFPENTDPFEVPLPRPDRISKLDPKAVAHQRRQSVASMALSARGLSDVSQHRLPTAGFQKSVDASSIAPNSPRMRTGSMGTMGTRQMLDDANSPLPSPGEQDLKRLSRLDLLRPKVLIMPAPLQDKLPGPKKNPRDGFFTSEDGGVPLPPGSRTDARPGIKPLSSMNPYNPRVSMSLSQLTFRQSLMVGGVRDPSYSDIDKVLKMASNDGERIEQEWSDEEETGKDLRPAGKLYGKSLIDDLEARKATIKGKQRVFTGDERPSMMQRPAVPTRQSTLIDPESLNSRPTTQYLSPTQVQEEIRRKRASGMPLVSLDSESALAPPRAGIPSARSVFGVDKIWERELAKLKSAEEADMEDDARLKALDAKLEEKRKSVLAAGSSSNLASSFPLPQTGPPRPSSPSADRSPKDRPELGGRRESGGSLGARGWFNSPESDDGEGTDRRASIASHLKSPFNREVSAAKPPAQTPGGGLGGGDSDEDVPLARQLGKRGQVPRQSFRPPAPPESDSDEDTPIAALKRHQSKSSAAPSANLGLPPINFDRAGSLTADFGTSTRATAQDGDDSSEDEVPLAVRHPSINRLSSMPSAAANRTDADSDEDDKPLGVKYSASVGGSTMQMLPFQQHQLLLQQQMLQQQIMMQTQVQMRASMAFGGGMMNPAMMGQGFGSPFAPPAMSMHAMNINAAHDAQTTQHSRVENWRRDVV